MNELLIALLIASVAVLAGIGAGVIVYQAITLDHRPRIVASFVIGWVTVVAILVLLAKIIPLLQHAPACP